MARKNQKRLKLGAKALAELVKPARLEVYESLQVGGPATVADLALRLGRPADSLYYHIRKLLAVGVVKELDETGSRPPRGGPGRKGAVYSIVTTRLDAKLDPDSRRSREAWTEGGASLLRLAQRNFGQALDEADGLRAEGPRRNLMLWRIKARLTPRQLRQVNEHIDALHELLVTHNDDPQGDLHAITCVMTPLEERDPR